jgi:glutamate 5-kinase
MTPGYLRHRAQIVGMLDERKWPHWWVENEISEGRITLLENETAVIGVEKKVYPGGLIELHGMFAAGEMAGVLELIEQAVEAARIAGCDVASIDSNPAWQRILKDKGFRPVKTLIEKDLRDGPQ